MCFLGFYRETTNVFGRRTEIAHIVGPFASGSPRAAFRRQFDALLNAKKRKEREARKMVRREGRKPLELPPFEISWHYLATCPPDWKPTPPDEFEWSRIFKS